MTAADGSAVLASARMESPDEKAEDEAAEGRPAEKLDDLLEGDELPELKNPEELAKVLFAILLSSREAQSVMRLAEVCNSTQKSIKAGLEHLAGWLRDQGFPVELHQAGEKYRLLTLPVVFPYLQRLRSLKKADKLSPAALETLAVVAYRQPVIRAEVESIRGVKAGPTLRSLLDHKLIKVVGRADVPGRPLQYGTTDHFLERFGLSSLKDLPSIQEFRSLG